MCVSVGSFFLSRRAGRLFPKECVFDISNDGALVDVQDEDYIAGTTTKPQGDNKNKDPHTHTHTHTLTHTHWNDETTPP